MLFSILFYLLSPSPAWPLIDPDSQAGVTLEPRATLLGHKHKVYSLAFSPDGQTLATSATGEKDVKLWNAVSGRLERVIPDLEVSREVAFDPQGKVLRTGLGEDSVRLWDVTSGKLISRLDSHSGWAISPSFSPSGRLVATASDSEPIVKLWNVENGQLQSRLYHPVKRDPARATFGGENHGIGNILFSPDGKLLATTIYRKAYLWEVESGKLAVELVDPSEALHSEGLSHEDTIYALAFDPSGRVLATAGREGLTKLWDVLSGRLKMVLKGDGGKVFRVAFDPTGNFVATGSGDGTVRLWDARTGVLRVSLPDHQDSIDSISISQDGRFIATASEKVARVWAWNTGRLLATLPDARQPVAFSPDGKLLATASKNPAVLVWDAATFK